MVFKELILLGLASLIVANNQHYHLNFNEKGHGYTEKIDIDRQKGIVIYDVPNHAGIGAAQFLKDFNMRLNVMRVITDGKCYVSKMQDNEPSLASIDRGIQKTSGVFPGQRYWVENKDFVPLRESNLLTLSPVIRQFCANFTVFDVVNVDDNLKENLLQNAKANLASGKSKRLIVNDYVYCKYDPSKMKDEIKKCYSDMSKMQIKCKILLQRHCSYVVTCAKVPGQAAFNCPGVHSFTQIHCCVMTCTK